MMEISFRPLKAEEVEWRDIPGYEGLYIASSDGRIFGCRSKKELKPETFRKRYAEVKLYKNGKGKIYKLHRLIASTFVENPDCKPQVNHIDGNKANNSANNLEWVTASENIRHAYSTGLMKPSLNNPIFDKKPVAALTEDGAVAMRFDSMTDAAMQLGLDVSNICNACHGRIKRTGGYKWRLVSEP